MGLFSSKSTSLGIDLGSSSFKMVEVQKGKKGAELVTYGFSELKEDVKSVDWSKNPKKAAMLIEKIYDEIGASSESAVVALPTFSVFSSVINLSKTSKKDLASSVTHEAKKIVPMPLEEMVLDWKVLEEDNNESTKVFLTGSPKKLVKSYVDVFKECKLSLSSLETENFSLIRSLVGGDQSVSMVVNIGTENSDISVVKNSVPVLNRSIEVGGLSISEAISEGLNINMDRAEQFKCDLGISSDSGKDSVVPQTIIKTINPVINEISYMLNLYKNKNDESVEKIILTGGGALLPNFSAYLSKKLNINVVVGDPFSRISYPEELKPVLSEVASRLAIAAGLSMRGMG